MPEMEIVQKCAEIRENENSLSQMRAEERRNKEKELFLTGQAKTQTEMARVLGVHRNTVVKDFRELKPEIGMFAEKMVDDISRKTKKDYNDARKFLREWMKLPDTEDNFEKRKFAIEMLPRLNISSLEAFSKMRTGLQIEEKVDFYAEMLEHVRRIKNEIRGGVQEGVK